MMKSVLLALGLSLLFVMQPEILLRQSPSCLMARPVSAVDKDMYTWVSSTYKRWSNLWLWLSEHTGVVYRVNSNVPRIELKEYRKTKALHLKNIFLFLLIETYLLRMSGSR